MRKTILVGCLMLLTYAGFGQLNVSFAEDTLTWVRLKDGNVSRSIKLNVSGINVSASNAISLAVLPGAPAIYSFTAPSPALMATPGTAQMSFPITINSGVNANNTPQFIGLQLSYNNGTNVIFDNIVIKIVDQPEVKADSTLKAFKYLAYVGTNFDLVDGVQAKNLFFASNIFLPPSSKAKVGFYLSLYGNRTMSFTDTSGSFRRATRMVSITDSTYKVYSKQTSLVRTMYSDNLGAYSSPLVQLWGKDLANALKVYFTPTLEFVWRRTHNTYQYSTGSNLDSLTEKGRISGTIDFDEKYKTNHNEYVFNLGAGLMLVHENDEISIRVHGSIGYSQNYLPVIQEPVKGSVVSGNPVSSYQKQKDVFFTGRAWITEPKTGLTLQAEITNTMENPRPFYGVTLSKALNFGHIGSIFQPISRR